MDKNTLRMDVSAKYFAEVNSVGELKEILGKDITSNYPVLVMGRGSNILFTQNFEGLVIRMNIKGKTLVNEDDDYVYLDVGAGEDWPDFVEYAVSMGWGGIENLALIPGTVGAAPVQNIAAYGHNLFETLVSVDTIKISDASSRTFTNAECLFDYRTSIFKTGLNGQYIITGVRFRLSKNPVLNLTYKSRYESLEGELALIAKPPYSVKDVSQAIINIRSRKLPDIAKVGTVGSVFKNPLISKKQLEEVRKICPDIQFYPEKNLNYSDSTDTAENVKIPAAWLIDNMGWGGKRIGNCEVWPTQPLNLVNTGRATPAEFMAFINTVKQAVYDKYGIELEPELRIYG